MIFLFVDWQKLNSRQSRPFAQWFIIDWQQLSFLDLALVVAEKVRGN